MTEQFSLVTERLRRHVQADTLDIGSDVRVVSRDDFVDQKRFEADREMFRQVPHVIGWAGELQEKGAFITRDIMGIPVLVTRTESGQLRAFINGCLHRGAAVAKGCGKARKFVCPYHAWTYDLDGRLVGVPDQAMFAGIDFASRGLRELPVSERGGVIAVGLTQEVSLEPYLKEIEDVLGAHRFGVRNHFATRQFHFKTNWKMALNVNFEGYHFKVLHRQSLDPVATNNSTYDFYGQHVRWIFPFRQFEPEKPIEGWPYEFQATAVYFLFPSCVLVKSVGSTLMLRIYPGNSPGECVFFMEFASVQPLVTEPQRELGEMTVEMTCQILKTEDLPQAEACQRGLEAGVPNIVLGRNEPILHHLAHHWRQASEKAAAARHP